MRARRTPFRGFFYGWAVLVIAVAMGVSTMPGQTVVLGGLYSDPIRRELGLSLSGVSGIYSMATIAAGMLLPLIGAAADRFGVRAAGVCVAVAFCGSMVLLAFVQGVTGLALAFFLMRLLGQGALGALAGHALAMWFERGLGRMHGVLATGFALGSAGVPLLIEPLIQSVGWRTSTVITAAVVGSVLVPLLIFAMRDRPEAIGQRLDGDDHPSEPNDGDERPASATSSPSTDPAFTLREAVRTRTYWILLGVYCYGGVVGTAILFHAKPMLESVGLAPSLAAVMATVWGLSQLPATLGGGWLADHFAPSRVLPIGQGLVFLGTMVMAAGLGFGAVPAKSAVIASMAILGLGLGLLPAVASPAIARSFGRTNHGVIRGSYARATVIATGVAPLLASAAFDLTGRAKPGGSWAPVVLGLGLVCVPLAWFASRLKAPAPPDRGDGCGEN